MDPPSLAGNCRPLESKLCIKAIDADKEKTLCKHRDINFSDRTVDSVETGSMQFVGRQEAWARLAAYQQVQRRCEKNLRLCSYRLRRSVKNDPLPLSAHTGVRIALLKIKKKVSFRLCWLIKSAKKLMCHKSQLNYIANLQT